MRVGKAREGEMSAREKPEGGSESREPILLKNAANGVVRLILNRPAARNALSVALLGELQQSLEQIAKGETAKVVVISANGPVFCAGHDLREIRANPGRQYYERVFAQNAKLMLSIVNLHKPVIAQVHGVATAAGCQLVGSCDLAVAAGGARFATPGVNIGLLCSTPLRALSRAIGRKAAMEMLLTGDFIDAATAKLL